MKRVTIFGEKNEDIRPLVEAAGFTVVDSSPELIVSYGGDGTLIRAEFSYPGIPKLILKGSRICKFCSPFPNDEVLRRVAQGRYVFVRHWKLAITVQGKKLVAVNDIMVHNADPRQAIRYTVTSDGKHIGNEIIGDGVVIATPLGSTGYYRSITDSMFESGIGIAFNNSTEQSDHVVLKESRKINVDILRGPAVVYADNQEEAVTLQDGESVSIEKSSETMNLVSVLDV